MSKVRISDMPLLPDVNGTEKIPTGGRGDYAVSINQIKKFMRVGLHQKLENHVNDKGNPHDVTKEQIGLSNVNNTSDIDKPISSATKNALNLKADKTYVDAKAEILRKDAEWKLKYEDLNELDEIYKNSSQDLSSNFEIDSKYAVLENINSEINTPVNKFQQSTAPIPAIGSFTFTSGQVYNGGIEHWKKLDSNAFIVPIHDIPTNTLTNAPAYRPFQPNSLWGQSVSSFKVRSQSPLMMRLTGSFSVLVKISDMSPEEIRKAGYLPVVPPVAWLELVSEEKTEISRNTRFGLSQSQTPVGSMVRKLDHGLILNPPALKYEDFTEDMLSSMPRKDLRYKNGYIGRSSISEDLTTGGGGDMTTDWFDIGSERIIHVRAPEGKTSSVSRIQYKDKYGNIYFGADQGWSDVSSNKLYNIPKDMVKARIWFKNPTDTAETLEVRAVTKEYDASFGYWAEYRFDVNQSVVFSKNGVYSFVIRFYNTDKNTHNLESTGFYIQSGGLTFMMNERNYNQLANNLYLKGV